MNVLTRVLAVESLVLQLTRSTLSDLIQHDTSSMLALVFSCGQFAAFTRDDFSSTATRVRVPFMTTSSASQANPVAAGLEGAAGREADR